MELRFVARESDYLLFEGEDGSFHRALIDDTVRDAVKNAQEIKTSGIVPKDVQQLLRSGSSVAEVARQFGVTESAIEPFAAPILDEIRYVVQSALETLVSDGQHMKTLQDLVLRSQPEATFSAHRTDSGWVLSAHGTHTYTWSYDPRAKLLEATNEAAQKLSSMHSARDVITQTVPVRSAPVAANQPAVSESISEEPQASVHDLVQELRSRRQRPEELKPSSAKGRASLPSWDEIVSGAHLDQES
jgi:hypothetical protein